MNGIRLLCDRGVSSV